MSAVEALGELNAETTLVHVEDEFNVHISGTWVGTITLYRRFPGDSTWFPFATTYTANIDLIKVEPEAACTYKAKMTAYTSGSANVRIAM